LHTPVDVIEAWPVAKTGRYLDTVGRLLKAKHGKKR